MISCYGDRTLFNSSLSLPFTTATSPFSPPPPFLFSYAISHALTNVNAAIMVLGTGLALADTNNPKKYFVA